MPVSITEWLALMEALSQGFAFSSLNTFYYLVRSILVKSEAHFDQYDLAFRDYFEGIETLAELRDEVLEWLKNPMNHIELTEDEVTQLERM
ncbi:MAG: VWA containing CoxE family protein, partial [Thermodesulfobacteriota bacterium]|nr:VWA containing CoxE family protein [Thermodesulfobacteriota bacterium]